MKPVAQVSNWGYFDALDGVTLQEGDQLRVQWPDGTITEETCRIHRASTRTQDHGHDVDLPFESAYVEKTYRGVSVPVWLRQPMPMILCEKIGATSR